MTEPVSPRLEMISLGAINEPDIPVRSTMDEQRMDELVASMKEAGLLCPIAVKPVDGRYEVIYGHRRYVAARRLKWQEIRALVMEDSTLSVHAARLHENAMREDVNAADEAIYLADLQTRLDLDEEGLCKLTRHSVSWVAERFSLLRNDMKVFEALRKGEINFAVARELNRCKDPALRKDYLFHAVAGGVSSRVVKGWVEAANLMPDRPQVATQADPTSPSPDPGAYVPEGCHLCGGSRDPANLHRPLFHTYCLDRLDKLVDGLARKEE